MTKRFDRIENNQKLHLQTLCGLCHFDYNSPGAFAYEQSFEHKKRQGDHRTGALSRGPLE